MRGPQGWAPRVLSESLLGLEFARIMRVEQVMTFKKGDYVSHPGKPEWGPGIVTEDPLDEKVRVLFVDGGEKLLLLRHARLDSFTGQDARLDRMNVDDPLSAEARLGPQRAREKFLAAYPEGFSSKAYQDEDRKPREAASRMMEELLGEEPMAQLIEAANWEEVGVRAVKILAATKLVVPSERKTLGAAFENPELAEKFTRTLCDLLYGFGTHREGDEEEGLRRRFERFIACLKEMGAAKWPIATYFLFMRFPEEHMLLRPTFAQRAATAFSFDLRYRAEISWLTYARLLELSRAILRDIEELEGQDMLDVQAFIWKLAR